MLYCKKECTQNPTGGEAKSFPDARKALGPPSYMEKGAEYTRQCPRVNREISHEKLTSELF